jgi:hypothetical protein
MLFNETTDNVIIWILRWSHWALYCKTILYNRKKYNYYCNFLTVFRNMFSIIFGKFVCSRLWDDSISPFCCRWWAVNKKMNLSHFYKNELSFRSFVCSFVSLCVCSFVCKFVRLYIRSFLIGKIVQTIWFANDCGG